MRLTQALYANKILALEQIQDLKIIVISLQPTHQKRCG